MQNVQSEQSEVAATAWRTGTVFESWLVRSREQVEDALAAHLKEIEAALGTHSRLADAVLYSVKAGGKRLRPILVLETCRACGGRAETALPAALAMELIHTFSLIHDDLPAMDDDDLRRGQPTNHKVFGEGLAILAGDWLATHALGLVAAIRIEPARIPRLLQALVDGTERMIAGQAADIEGERRPANPELVRYIHRHKTAALLETCCRLGAICGGASEEPTEALARYGQHLGLAFQITDDLLDATGSVEQTGKRVQKDAAATKQTYPAAFGLDESRVQAGREIEAALQALAPFGSRADRLRELAQHMVERNS